MKTLIVAPAVALAGILAASWFTGDSTSADAAVAMAVVEPGPADEGEKLKCTGKHRRFILDNKIDWGLTGEIFDTVIPCLEAGYQQEIIINSPGGSPTTAHGIYEALRLADGGGKLTTTVFGNSHSAAVYVFLAGATRKISCSSTVLIHPVTLRVVASSNDRTELDSFPERWEKTEERSVSILSNRTSLTKDEVREMKLGHRLLSATDAVSYGIATDVIGCV